MKKRGEFLKRYKNLFIILGIGFFIIFLAADIYLYFYFTPRCFNFKGDANGDKRIDENDIVHINNYFSGGELNCKKNADVNEDGRVDISDGEELSNYFSNSNRFSPGTGGDGGVSGGGFGQDSGESQFSQDTGQNEEGAGEEDETVVCDGCLVDRACYPIGYRQDGEFCSDNEDFIAQLNTKEQCQNNFECKSNICGSGECIDSGGEQQSLTCSNNPALICNAELNCLAGAGCNCYQECGTNWCWGASDKNYVCKSGCASVGSYAPSSHDCCDPSSYSNGKCSGELKPAGEIITCETNPVGKCNGAELSCDLGYTCDCPEECASNACSSSGKCIYIGGIKPGDNSYGGGGGSITVDSSSGGTTTSGSPPASTSGSAMPSGSPISFSPYEEKPFYQRLIGWFTKTITGWFTDEVVLIS